MTVSERYGKLDGPVSPWNTGEPDHGINQIFFDTIWGRMPEKLVRTIDALQEEGIYTSRTEVILDSVRRLVTAFQTNDPIKQSVARSLHGKTGSGSFRDIA